MTVHCYPLAEPRHAPFNETRAQLCEKECSRPREAFQGHQSATLAALHSSLAAECGASEAKNFKACKRSVFSAAQLKLDLALKQTLDNSVVP